jgi:flagellar basal-body rod protein FlgG
MSGAIYQAAAGALLQQMRMDVLSNNLANVNSTGYKADRPAFRLDTETESEEIPGETAPGRLSPYAPPLEVLTDFTPGPANRTGNPLDVAVVGDGFLEVQTPEGPRYTRNGNLSINNDGLLSTSNGWPVMGQGGEIAIDGSKVEISARGEIYVDGEAVDLLRVVDFDQSQQLVKTGDTLFEAPEGAVATAVDEDQVQIAQGFLEGANVDAIRTMTDMIETMRVFEAYQRVIRSVDETTAKTVNEVGKVA